jgi:eukaryotic-like serine/threonine-protein kinase
MDVKTWTTISRLLDDALDVPPGERESWLSGLGADYAALLPDLRALLDRAASMDEAAFLDTLPKVAATDADSHVPGAGAGDSRAGTAIGPYTLVRPIASGGQGAVWLAERTDGLVKRPVALKLPHGLAYRPGLAERMAREREILASLNHPHIARLYDAGVSAESEPYLALEYVEGSPIDQHCRDRGLAVHDRVRLFLQVVRAVAYAHGQLVIHRDLKPSNILVTTDGYVRMLDFGIAKLLATDAPADSTLTTDAGRALTLPYASPEQVLHEPLGVASDVYSLGTVLYELLTGVRPHKPARASAAALEEAILGGDIPRPSEVVPHTTARKAMVGDLETVVLKALKRSPAERYVTADAFADDLERALDGRPVLAQPDTRTYRARRFVGRHRGSVTTAAAALLAVLAGAGVAIWQARVARAERDAALVQQARAEASSGFLDSLLQQAGGRSVSATTLLDRGTEQLDRAQGIDASVLPFLRYEVSKHYMRFNQTDRELALLATVAGDARRVGDFDLLAAAECSSASAIVSQNADRAATHLTAGEAALERAGAPSLVARSDCVRARARVLSFTGKVDEGIQLVERSLPEFPPTRASLWSRHGILRIELHTMYARAGRYAESLRLAEEVLADMRFKGMTGTLNEFSQLGNVAANLMRVGEVRQALAAYRELVAWLDRGAFTIEPLGVLTGAAGAELRAGEPAAALRLAQRAYEGGSGAGNRRVTAASELLLAQALVANGRGAESRARLDRAEAFWAANPRGNDRQLGAASLTRARLLAADGRVAEARALAAAALAALGYPGRTASPGLDDALRVSAHLHLQSGDPRTAAEHASAALALARRAAREERRSADVGESSLLRAQAYDALGRRTEALADASLAADALGESLGPDHALTAQATTLARVLATPSDVRR